MGKAQIDQNDSIPLRFDTFPYRFDNEQHAHGS
jgi:hypothetical protein